jgi:hypothetical protein
VIIKAQRCGLRHPGASWRPCLLPAFRCRGDQVRRRCGACRHSPNAAGWRDAGADGELIRVELRRAVSRHPATDRDQRRRVLWSCTPDGFSAGEAWHGAAVHSHESGVMGRWPPRCWTACPREGVSVSDVSHGVPPHGVRWSPLVASVPVPAPRRPAATDARGRPRTPRLSTAHSRSPLAHPGVGFRRSARLELTVEANQCLERPLEGLCGLLLSPLSDFLGARLSRRLSLAGGGARCSHGKEGSCHDHGRHRRPCRR